jgi:glucan biosynthesis protein C
MFNGVYPAGNFSWHHLWFIAYLFFISLIISPFLNYLRGDHFAQIISGIEKLVTRPLALNICVIPLLISQFLLRPFFEMGTNDFIHDWASITYYFLFFLMGYILIPVGSITESMYKSRYWYLAEVIVFTVILFIVPSIAGDKFYDTLFWDISAIFLAWSCTITVIGFSKNGLNRNSRKRKLANEAIYPFYLLHQPVIVVIGYFAVQWDLPAVLKAVIITFSSLTVFVLIYLLVIRPFNLFRLIFGMKKKTNSDESKLGFSVLQPALVNTSK